MIITGPVSPRRKNMTPDKLNRIKKLLTALVLAVLAAVLAVLNVQGMRAPAAAASDGLYFKDMHLTDFSGGTFTAADLYRNRLTFFTVWNPYCTACIKEMPLLDKLDKEYASSRVRIVGIEGDAWQYPQDVEKARAIVKKSGTDFLQLLADGDFTKEILPLMNNAYPVTFMVDGRGIIRDVHAGTMSEAAWRAWIDTYLPLTENTAL